MMIKELSSDNEESNVCNFRENNNNKPFQSVFDKLWVLLSLRKYQNLSSRTEQGNISESEDDSEGEYEVKVQNAADDFRKALTNEVIDSITNNQNVQCCTPHSFEEFVYLLGRVSDAFLDAHVSCVTCSNCNNERVNSSDGNQQKEKCMCCEYDTVANRIEQMFVKLCHGILLLHGTESIETIEVEKSVSYAETRAIWALTEGILALQYSYKPFYVKQDLRRLNEQMHKYLISLCYGVKYIFLRALSAATNGHNLEGWVYFFSNTCVESLEEANKEKEKQKLKVNVMSRISDSDEDEDDNENEEQFEKLGNEESGYNVVKDETNCDRFKWHLVKSNKITNTNKSTLTIESLELWADNNNVELLNRTVGRTKYRRAILRFRSFTPINILQDPIHSLELIELLHHFSKDWEETMISSRVNDNKGKDSINSNNTIANNSMENSVELTTAAILDAINERKKSTQSDTSNNVISLASSIRKAANTYSSKIELLCIILERYADQLQRIIAKSAMNDSLLVSIVACFLCEKYLLKSVNEIIPIPIVGNNNNNTHSSSLSSTQIKSQEQELTKIKPAAVVSNLSKRRTLAELRSGPVSKITPSSLTSSLTTESAKASRTTKEKKEQSTNYTSSSSSSSEEEEEEEEEPLELMSNNNINNNSSSNNNNNKQRENKSHTRLGKSSNKEIVQLTSNSRWLTLNYNRDNSIATSEINTHIWCKFVPIGLLLEVLHLNAYTISHWFHFVQHMHVGLTSASRSEYKQKMSLLLWLTSLIDLPLSLILYYYACNDISIPLFKYNEHYQASNFDISSTTNTTNNNNKIGKVCSSTKALAEYYENLHKEIICNENDVMLPGLELSRFTTSMNNYASSAESEFILHHHPTNTSTSTTASSSLSSSLFNTRKTASQMRKGEEFGERFTQLVFESTNPPVWLLHVVPTNTEETNDKTNTNIATTAANNNSKARKINKKLVLQASTSLIHYFVTLLLAERYEYAASALAYLHDEMHINVFLISYEHLPWNVSVSTCLLDVLLRWLRRAQHQLDIYKVEYNAKYVHNSNNSDKEEKMMPNVKNELVEYVYELLRSLNVLLPLLRYAQSYVASQRLLHLLLVYVKEVSLFTLKITSKNDVQEEEEYEEEEECEEEFEKERLNNAVNNINNNDRSNKMREAYSQIRTTAAYLIEEYLIQFVMPCLGVLSPSPILYSHIEELFRIMSTITKCSNSSSNSNDKCAFLNISRWWSYNAPESSLLVSNNNKSLLTTTTITTAKANNNNNNNNNIIIFSNNYTTKYVKRIYYPHEIIRSKELQSLFVQSLKRLNHDNLPHYRQLLRSVLYTEPLFVLERIFNHAIGYENNFMSLHVRLLANLPSAFYTLTFQTGVALMSRYAEEEKWSSDSINAKSNNRVTLIAHFLSALLRENLACFNHTQDNVNVNLLFKFVESKLRTATYSNVYTEQIKLHSSSVSSSSARATSHHIHRPSLIVGVELLRALCYELLHRQCESEERFNDLQIETLALPHSTLVTQFAARGSLESLRLVRWNKLSDVNNGEQFSTGKLQRGRSCVYDALTLQTSVLIVQEEEQEEEQKFYDNDNKSSSNTVDKSVIDANVDDVEESNQVNEWEKVSFSLGQLILLHLCRLRSIIYQAQAELDGPVDVVLLTTTREYNTINDLIFIILEAFHYKVNEGINKGSKNDNNKDNLLNERVASESISLVERSNKSQKREEQQCEESTIRKPWCMLLQRVALPHLVLAILVRMQSNNLMQISKPGSTYKVEWNEKLALDTKQLAIALYQHNTSNNLPLQKCDDNLQSELQERSNNDKKQILIELFTLLSTMNSSSFELVTEPFTIAKSEVKAALLKTENLRLYMTNDDYLESIAWLREQEKQIAMEQEFVEELYHEQFEYEYEEREEHQLEKLNNNNNDQINHHNYITKKQNISVRRVILQTMSKLFASQVNTEHQNVSDDNTDNNNDNFEASSLQIICTEFVASYLYPRALLSLSDAHFVSCFLSWLYTATLPDTYVKECELSLCNRLFTSKDTAESCTITCKELHVQVINIMCTFVTMMCTFFVGLTDSETRRVGHVVTQIVKTLHACRNDITSNGTEKELTLTMEIEQVVHKWEAKEKQIESLNNALSNGTNTGATSATESSMEIIEQLFNPPVRSINEIIKETKASNSHLVACRTTTNKSEQTQKELSESEKVEYVEKIEPKCVSALPLQLDAVLVQFLYSILHNHDDIPNHIHRNALSLTDLLIRSTYFPASITSSNLLLRAISSHANKQNINYAAAMATLKLLRAAVHQAKKYLSTLQEFISKWNIEVEQIQYKAANSDPKTKESDIEKEKIILNKVESELEVIKQRELYMQELLTNVEDHHYGSDLSNLELEEEDEEDDDNNNNNNEEEEEEEKQIDEDGDEEVDDIANMEHENDNDKPESDEEDDIDSLQISDRNSLEENEQVLSVAEEEINGEGKLEEDDAQELTPLSSLSPLASQRQSSFASSMEREDNEETKLSSSSSSTFVEVNVSADMSDEDDVNNNNNNINVDDSSNNVKEKADGSIDELVNNVNSRKRARSEEDDSSNNNDSVNKYEVRTDSNKILTYCKKDECEEYLQQEVQ